MDTLEEKLLEKMTYCHYRHEILCSIEKAANALCRWIELYNDGVLPRHVVSDEISKISANLEFHIQLLKRAYYPNIQEFKQQIIQELAKEYDIVDNN